MSGMSCMHAMHTYFDNSCNYEHSHFISSKHLLIYINFHKLQIFVTSSTSQTLQFSRILELSDCSNIQYSVAWVRRRELYRPRDRCLSAKIVPTLADRGCRVVSVNFSFLDRSHYFLEIAPQLSSRGWVDPVPDPLLLRKNLIAPGIEPRPLDL
jgi:hypothetical protein